MTIKTKTFSLFDFCKKRADRLEVYGKESLDEEGNIIPFIDQAAYVTHYLQLKRSGVTVPYADRAEGCKQRLRTDDAKPKKKAFHSLVAR